MLSNVYLKMKMSTPGYDYYHRLLPPTSWTLYGALGSPPDAWPTTVAISRENKIIIRHSAAGDGPVDSVAVFETPVY